jgi:hypothetical protein
MDITEVAMNRAMRLRSLILKDVAGSCEGWFEMDDDVRMGR